MNLNGCYILKRVTYRKASKLTNTFCVIDDLGVVNENPEFEKKLLRNLPVRISIKKRK